jgi:tetratricopeptide (TPR) repeat protein
MTSASRSPAPTTPGIQKYPRYRLNAPIDLFTALSEHRGLPLENISLGGVFIRTTEPPPPGARVKLLLQPDLGDATASPLRLIGRVVHVIDERMGQIKAHPPGIGVQFEGVTGEIEAQLQRLVDALAERARRERVRRSGARFVDHATVYVRPERDLLTELWGQSLKHGGLFAEGDPPPFGTQLTVVIGSMHVRAEVVHVQENGAGLQLKDFDGVRATAIQRFVDGETEEIEYQEDKPVGPPLGKVLAVVRRLFAGLEEDDPLGALGLAPTAHEKEVQTRAEGLRRLLSVKPPGASPPQLARIDAAFRAVARAEPLALTRVAALRKEAELAVAGKKDSARDEARKLVAEATSLEARGLRMDARRCLERALELTPTDDAIRRRYEALTSQMDIARAADLLASAEVFVTGVGMTEQAIRNAREAARITSMREIRLRAIRVLAKACEYTDAELLAQELLEKDPRDALALQALMLIHEKAQNWSEAARAGEALVRLKPYDEDIAKRVKKIVEQARKARR